MPVFKRLTVMRLVASAAVLDKVEVPADHQVLRIASDEMWLYPEEPAVATAVLAADAHAICLSDSSFASLTLPEPKAQFFLKHNCAWQLPSKRPAFAQGAVAGIPTKLFFDGNDVLFLVPAPYAVDFEERLP